MSRLEDMKQTDVWEKKNWRMESRKPYHGKQKHKLLFVVDFKQLKMKH